MRFKVQIASWVIAKKIFAAKSSRLIKKVFSWINKEKFLTEWVEWPKLNFSKQISESFSLKPVHNWAFVTQNNFIYALERPSFSKNCICVVLFKVFGRWPFGLKFSTFFSSLNCYNQTRIYFKNNYFDWIN